MLFFTGMHRPHDAHYVPRAFVSINVISKRKSEFRANDWIMDSGAFTEISNHGMWRYGVDQYAKQIKRWTTNANLLAAVSQDYMCEPWILKKTGKTIQEHQQLTVNRYKDLVQYDTGGTYIIPVLQGFAPEDYLRCIGMYGYSLKPESWVGVGSVCKRNGNPNAIKQVLSAIRRERPDIYIHGFGLKKTALKDPDIRKDLFSSDSMAWSYQARYAKRDANSPLEAVKYTREIEEILAED